MCGSGIKFAPAVAWAFGGQMGTPCVSAWGSARCGLEAKVVGTYRAAAAAATTRSASSARSPGSRVTSSSSGHAGDDDSSDEDDGDGSSDARAMVEPSGQHRMRAHGEQQSRRQQRQHNVSV